MGLFSKTYIFKNGAPGWKNQWDHYLYNTESNWIINTEYRLDTAPVFAKEESEWTCPNDGLKKWMYLGSSGYHSTLSVNAECYGKYMKLQCTNIANVKRY